MAHPMFVAINVNHPHTRIILTKDATGTDFSAATEIDIIEDKKNPGIWLAAVTEWNKGGNAKRLPVKLVVLRHPDQSGTKPVTGPDSGTISITLYDGTATPPVVDKMDITYVAE